MLDQFIRRLTQRGLESPSIPLTGANINSILTSERPSGAGINVTRDAALAIPALKAGVEMIASDVAKLPIFVYRRGPDGNKEELRQHPASQLLRHKCNPWITGHTLLKTLVGHALLHRGGYARIFRDGAGRPEAMDILDPEETYPIIVEGELLYQARINGEDRLLAAEDVLHIKGLGFDGLSGWSLIDKLREALGLALASQQYAAVYFANNARPSVVIKFPGYLKDAEAVKRFRESWGGVHAGVNNAARPAILEGGAEITPFSISNEDSQFIESRQFDLRMIAAALKIPPHKLGDDSRTSFASLEQENQRYLDEGVDPWLREIEVAAADKLLSLQEWTAGVSVEFERAAFIRTNLEARYTAYNTAIMAGFMSRADVRRKENMNVDDPSLEEYLQPLNMAPAGEDPEPEPEPEPTPSEDQARARAALHRTTEHQCRQLVLRVAKSAERAAGTPSTFLRWLDRLEGSHGHVFVRDFGAICGEDVARELVQEYLQEIRSELLDAAEVQPDQLPEAVRQVMAAALADHEHLAQEVINRWQRIPAGAA